MRTFDGFLRGVAALALLFLASCAGTGKRVAPEQETSRLVALPGDLNAREQSFLTEAVDVLEKYGYEPVDHSMRRKAPFSLEMELSGFNPIAKRATITLLHRGVPIATGLAKPYNVLGFAMRTETYREAFKEALADFEQSLARRHRKSR
jgi:hypothetical protein